MSGTNAHLILQAPPETDATASSKTAPPLRAASVPWVVSGATGTALRAQAARLRDAVGGAAPVDVEWTPGGRPVAPSAPRRGHGPVRPGRGGAIGFGAGRGPRRGRPTARVAFIFPGQGAQWAGMARELLDSSPVFAQQIEACAEALAPYVDWSLPQVLGAASAGAWLEQVDVVQPVLWAVMVSLPHCGVPAGYRRSPWPATARGRSLRHVWPVRCPWTTAPASWRCAAS